MSMRERWIRLPQFIFGSLSRCLIIATVMAGPLLAETIRLEYSFDTPRLESVVIDGSPYIRVIMPSAPAGGVENEPSLPSAGARILLPPGAEVAVLFLQLS